MTDLLAYEETLAFANAALRLIRQKQRGSKQRGRPQRQALREVIDAHAADIAALPEFRDAARRLRDEWVLELPKDSATALPPAQEVTWDERQKQSEDWERWSFDFLRPRVLDILKTYIAQAETFSLHTKEFRIAFESHFASRAVEYRAAATLVNLTSRVRSVRLADGLTLETESAAEAPLAMWSVLQHLADAVGQPAHPSDRFVLHGRYTESWTQPHQTGGHFLRSGQAVITALRLLKAGDVGTVAVVEYIVTPDVIRNVGSVHPLGRFRATTTPHLAPPHQSAGYPEQYNLLEADVPNLVTLHQKLLAVEDAAPRWRRFAVATRRFNLAFSRSNADDAIIDLSIALESTLLADSPGGLSYRMALRGASLLRDRRSPEEVFEFLRFFYKARNLIVHEGQQLELIVSEEKFREYLSGRFAYCAHQYGVDWHPELFVGDARQLVREVLLEYLERGAKGDDPLAVNRDLELSAVRGLARKAAEA